MFDRANERAEAIGIGRALFGGIAFALGFGFMLWSAWCFTPAVERFLEGL